MVDSAGTMSVSASIAAETSAENGPGSVRNASPEISACAVPPWRAAISETRSARARPLCSALKRIEIRAVARGGMTLWRRVADGDVGDLEVRGLEPVGAASRAPARRARRAARPAWAPDCRRGADRRRGPRAPRPRSSQMLTEPRRPILTVSPSRSTEVGSPTRHRSGIAPARAHVIDQRDGAVARRAFLVAGDDEAERARLGGDLRHCRRPSPRSRPSCRPRRGRGAGRRAARARTAPRSSPRPAARRRDGRRRRNGGCPADPCGSRTGSRPDRRAPRRRASGGPSKPSGISAASRQANTAPVAGVTLGQAIRASARAAVSMAVAAHMG